MIDWIDVKDRLPDKNGRYLVWIKKPMHGVTYVGELPIKEFPKVLYFIATERGPTDFGRTPRWEESDLFLPPHDVEYITHWAPVDHPA